MTSRQSPFCDLSQGVTLLNKASAHMGMGEIDVVQSRDTKTHCYDTLSSRWPVNQTCQLALKGHFGDGEAILSTMQQIGIHIPIARILYIYIHSIT